MLAARPGACAVCPPASARVAVRAARASLNACSTLGRSTPLGFSAAAAVAPAVPGRATCRRAHAMAAWTSGGGFADDRPADRRRFLGAPLLLPAVARLSARRGMRSSAGPPKSHVGWMPGNFVLPRPSKDEIWSPRDSGVPFQFPQPPAQFSRLREHYHDTVAHDLMLLNYDHEHATKTARQRADRRRVEEAAALDRTAPPPVELGPEDADPLLWDPEYDSKTPESRKARAEAEAAAREASLWLRYRPDPDYYDLGIPQLVGVTVSAVLAAGCQNKFYLCNAYSVVQAVAGVHPTLSYADSDDHEISMRVGMPIGCHAFLEGDEAWSFVERLLIVLPRIKDYRGVPSQAGEGSSLKMIIAAAEAQGFPDLEPILGNLSHQCAIAIEFHTTAKCPTRTRALLSGLGIAFRKRQYDEDVVDRVRKNQEEENEQYEGQHAREAQDRFNRRKYEAIMQERMAMQDAQAQVKADRIRRAAFAAKKAKRPPFYDWL